MPDRQLHIAWRSNGSRSQLCSGCGGSHRHGQRRSIRIHDVDVQLDAGSDRVRIVGSAAGNDQTRPVESLDERTVAPFPGQVDPGRERITGECVRVGAGRIPVDDQQPRDVRVDTRGGSKLVRLERGDGQSIAGRAGVRTPRTWLRLAMRALPPFIPVSS